MNATLKRRNSLLLGMYAALSVFCILPATGVAFNSSSPVLGVPVSVLWLGGCFFALSALTVVGYFAVFKPWSQELDGTAQTPRPRAV